MGCLPAQPALTFEIGAETLDLRLEGLDPRLVVGSVHDSSAAWSADGPRRIPAAWCDSTEARQPVC
jgi:hypothetical protein